MATFEEQYKKYSTTGRGRPSTTCTMPRSRASFSNWRAPIRPAGATGRSAARALFSWKAIRLVLPTLWQGCCYPVPTRWRKPSLAQREKEFWITEKGVAIVTFKNK